MTNGRTPQHSSRSRPRVVVLDDDSEYDRVLTAFLEEQGMEALGYLRKDEFLQEVADIPPDVIITDLHSPGMGGAQFLELVKKAKHGKHIPVIVVSGFMDGYSIESLTRLGAFGCLQKPAADTDLMASICAALKQ